MSLESRYGMCDSAALFLLRPASASPVMTLRRVKRLLLMSIDSFWASPVAPV